MSKYYITTPIYYINDVPHIGHAYTTVAADVLARYHRAKGEDVFFLTGVDEHGAKIAEAAKKAGKEPKQFVDELVPVFQKTWRNLNIDYSEFFRTTNPEHEKFVQDFVRTLVENGYVEKRKYEGLYCISCERYYKEEELVDGKCPDHKRELVVQSEENYFFLLSKLGGILLERIEKGEMEIGPESRKNEVISKIKLGLEDISISRANVEWGIPFPGDPSQTIYVWVDALLNYFTATKIYARNGQRTTRTTNDQSPTWPADLHLMAKDILWFHAVIWPSMLIAAGYPLPRKVFAHGFFTINGQKMSKTIGNVIDPNEVIDKFGSDAVRYALLREFPFGEDGDISIEKIGKRYEEDLANGLGNLLQRTLSMINRYETGIDQKVGGYTVDEKQSNTLPTSRESIDYDIEGLEFEIALAKIWKIISEGNIAINDSKPWELAKENKRDELSLVLNIEYSRLSVIADLIYPFMPETAEKIKHQLANLKPEPLFPRLEY